MGQLDALTAYLGPIGSEHVAPPSMTSADGKPFDPVVGTWPGGRPMLQSEREAVARGSVGVFQQLAAMPTGGAPVGAGRVMAASQRAPSGLPPRPVPGGVGGGEPGGFRLLTAAERRQFQNPRSVADAKYVLPDGRLLGGDSHEHVSDRLGYGFGDDGVRRFMQDTGAARVNVANWMFADDGSGQPGAISLEHPPTDAQMAALARYVNRWSPADVGYRGEFATVQNGAELRRFLNGLFGQVGAPE